MRAKAQALVSYVGGQPPGAQRAYALLTLANKLVSQCEVQARTRSSDWVMWAGRGWGSAPGGARLEWQVLYFCCRHYILA